MNPQKAKDIVEEAYDPDDRKERDQNDGLWQEIKGIHDRALQCEEHQKDENAWSDEVVRPILLWGDDFEQPFFQLVNVFVFSTLVISMLFGEAILKTANVSSGPAGRRRRSTQTTSPAPVKAEPFKRRRTTPWLSRTTTNQSNLSINKLAMGAVQLLSAK